MPDDTLPSPANGTRIVIRLLLRSAATCLGLLSCAVVLAEPSGASPLHRLPRFEDFPAGQVFTGANRLLLRSADDRLFRTRLREAARRRPDFAGHYVLARWGCGAMCQSVEIIDVRSGRVIWTPGSICCWTTRDNSIEPVRFRPDSSLLILTGLRNEKEGDNGAHYYRIEGSRLVHLKDVWTPPPP